MTPVAVWFLVDASMFKSMQTHCQLLLSGWLLESCVCAHVNFPVLICIIKHVCACKLSAELWNICVMSGETRKADGPEHAPPTWGLEILRVKQREAGIHLPASPPETAAVPAGSMGFYSLVK